MPRDPITQLFARVAELERRQANMVRPAKVVANEGGRVRVSDGAGFDPEPMPQASVSAGTWKIDAPAGAGTAGIVLCPEGEPSLARFIPTDAYDGHPAGSTDPGKMTLTGPGGETIVIEGGRIEIDTPGEAVVRAPVVLVESADVRLGGSGGKKVARIGDAVAGGVIVEGSGTVTAID